MCREPDRFFAEHDECYVRRSPGRFRNRRYFEIFATNRGSLRDAFPGADAQGACPCARHAYQPMRNLAVAEALVQDELWAIKKAWFVLCARGRSRDRRTVGGLALPAAGSRH